MHYQSFLDHIGQEGCIPLPEFDIPPQKLFRNIYNGLEGFVTEDPVWISDVHAIAFCLDMDIEIPAELEGELGNFDQLGLM